MTLYKVLNTDGTACYGGTLQWPVPNGKPGRWVKVEGELVPCRNGLHLCREQDLLDWLGPAIYVAEAGRERVDGGNKLVVRRARLVAKTAWDDRAARLFACDCAERALVRERDAGREQDPRSWLAVEVARAFADGAATEAELDAARDAAEAAAWDAARAAAEAAAWDAARDAAEAAVWAAGEDIPAAWDAAEAAEREWQTSRLIEYLEGIAT